MSQALWFTLAKCGRGNLVPVARFALWSHKSFHFSLLETLSYYIKIKKHYWENTWKGPKKRPSGHSKAALRLGLRSSVSYWAPKPAFPGNTRYIHEAILEQPSDHSYIRVSKQKGVRTPSWAPVKQQDYKK